jgi:hypothetical protein
MSENKEQVVSTEATEAAAPAVEAANVAHATSVVTVKKTRALS